MDQDNQPQPGEVLDEKEWTRQEHGKVLEYASRNTLDLSRINQNDSVILPPLIAVWSIESKSHSKGFWIITGDLPSDHIVGENAQNARDAIKHFSLRWQLKAENILIELEQNHTEEDSNNTKRQFAEILISKADGLYKCSERDDLWKNE